MYFSQNRPLLIFGKVKNKRLCFEITYLFSQIQFKKAENVEVLLAISLKYYVMLKTKGYVFEVAYLCSHIQLKKKIKKTTWNTICDVFIIVFLTILFWIITQLLKIKGWKFGISSVVDIVIEINLVITPIANVM